MISIDEFCGEDFVIIYNKQFGKCFKQLCIIYPIFCLLLITSSYNIAFNEIGYRLGKRPLPEYLVVLIRVFASLFLGCTGLYNLYELFNDNNNIPSDVIQALVICVSWIVHGNYVLSLLKNKKSNARGPLNVNIVVVLCFSVITTQLYIKYRGRGLASLKISDIIIVISQVIYLLTLIPNESLRSSETTEQLINVINPEEQPLLSSVPCRYSAFQEELDPEDLGTAEEVNVFSKIFFSWVKPLMVKGYHNKLKTADDLFDLPETLQAEYLTEKSSRTIDSRNSSENSHSRNNHLIRKLHTLYGLEFYSIGILKLISDCLLFGGPLFLNALVSYLENNDIKKPKIGYYYALGLFLSALFGALCSTHYNYLISRIGLKIKAYLILIIYRKTLLTSKVTLSCRSSGEILNFISTDTDRIVNFCQSFHQFWSLPIQVIISLVLLYQQVNYCFLIGIAFIIFVIPINQYIAKKIGNYSTFLMFAKDKRIKLMNEILTGIRVIKMNTWEQTFCQKVDVIRNMEVKYLKKRKYLDALCVYFWATTPVVMSCLTFTLYSALGYALTASKIFTSISLFNILITPLNAFPWVLNGLMEAWVSLKRVNSFLELPELDFLDYYSEPSKQDLKLEINSGVFSYTKEKDNDFMNVPSSLYNYNTIPDTNPSVLGPLSFKVSQGEFVCVIGRVGSGKSSLLASILADICCVSGEVKMHISDRKNGIGYISQNPWIQQKSIKDNILFGKAFNSLRYSNVLESCALVQDLKALPYGDNTKVGDKGVTLSGGQKARVALARAVYQDYDIYLLDDPFSAVDSHVADHIFSNCIMGLLKNKTRILCTHKTKFAESANYVLILSDGKVISQGPPNQTLQFYFMNENSEPMSDELEEREIFKETVPEDKRLTENFEEEKEEGVVKLHVYKSYWKAIGSCLSLAVLLFCFLMQASKTTSDWWLSYWISNIKSHEMNSTSGVFSGKDSNYQNSTLIFYLSIYGGLTLANSVFALLRAFLFAFAGIKAAIVLHDKLLSIIIKAQTCFFDVTPLGRIINRFSSDVYCIDDTLPFVMNILLAQVFSLVGAVIITCYGLPWIFFLIAGLYLLYDRIQNYYRYTSRELKRLSSISLSPIYAHFSETLNGQSVIRALAANTKFEKANMDHLDCNLRALLASTAASQWLNLRLQFIGVIIVTGVSVIALVQGELGDVDAALIGLALSYALSITSLLNGTITAFTETEKEIVSVERVMQYIEGVETEIPFDPLFSRMTPFGWPSHGVITFKNVSLKYRPSCPYALKGLNFETRPGEKIGIVGRTGSGKSSLIQLLCRMVNTYKGTVFIDGVNIAELGLKQLRSGLSVIPQDPFLFSGSIRENLDPVYRYSDAELWKALRYCHIEEKLQSLGGLDVRIEEMGQNFSNGERQLICLGRALLQRAKILCLDEATASIDQHTDSLVRHTVRMEFRHSTVLIIAHRMETIMDCDRVMVMKNGEIIEFDKPSNLLSDTKSEFYGLVYSKAS